jgi:hypothetical protein
MLSNYIFAYKSISLKNIKIVSPATFVNKSDIALMLYNDWRISATSMQSIKICLCEQLEVYGITFLVVPHYLLDNSTMSNTTSGQDHQLLILTQTLK